MTYMGIATMDELGRVLLPRILRQKHGWQPGSRLQVHMGQDQTAMLKLYEVSQEDLCNICDSDEPVSLVRGFKICAACLFEFNQGSK